MKIAAPGAVLAMLVLAGCGSPAPRPSQPTATVPAAATIPPPPVAPPVVAREILETLHVDLDGDAKPDELILDAPPKRPLSTLTLRLTSAPELVIQDRDWMPFMASDFVKHVPGPNAVTSEWVYVQRVRGATLLFFSTAQYGCCVSGMSVVAVTPSTSALIFESDELLMEDWIAEKNAAVVVGWPSMTECDGIDGHPELGTVEMYSPLLAHRLGKVASLDEARSRRLTRARLGGWAGPEYREDVAVAHPEGARPRLVRRSNGEPFVE